MRDALWVCSAINLNRRKERVYDKVSSHKVGGSGMCDGTGRGAVQRSVAAQEKVLCPVAEVQTEITTRLPNPWWNTPQVGKLESVSVQVIAGEKTLVCSYWAYGTKVGVMRKFPAGAHDCRAIDNRFECR
jgi:hypothetical protein